MPLDSVVNEIRVHRKKPFFKSLPQEINVKGIFLCFENESFTFFAT